jgi:hypothetical protein
MVTMAVSEKAKCVHQFVATSRKGTLEVETFSLNKRGKPQNVHVSTTVFECSKCGASQEYPDTWEKNFKLIATPAKRGKKNVSILVGKHKRTSA